MNHSAYQLRIGRGLKSSWENFLKGPEVYLLVTLGWMFLGYVLTRIPNLGSLFSLLISALALPSFFVLAEEGRKRGKVEFSDLLRLAPLAPQLLALFVVKALLIGLGFMLLVLPGVYLLVIYFYAEVIAVSEKRTFWESMEASRQLVRGQWMATFGLLIVTGLIVLTGALLVGVGLLAAIPLAALLLHSVFLDIRRQSPEVLPAQG